MCIGYKMYFSWTNFSKMYPVWNEVLAHSCQISQMFSQKNFGLHRKKNHVPALISGLVQNISALGFAIICRVRNVMQLRAHYSVTHHIVHPNIHPGSLFQFLHNSNTLMILGTNHQHRTLIHKHLRTLTHALSNLRHLATDAPRESYRFFRAIYNTHTIFQQPTS